MKNQNENLFLRNGLKRVKIQKMKGINILVIMKLRRTPGARMQYP